MKRPEIGKATLGRVKSDNQYLRRIPSCGDQFWSSFHLASTSYSLYIQLAPSRVISRAVICLKCRHMIYPMELSIPFRTATHCRLSETRWYSFLLVHHHPLLITIFSQELVIQINRTIFLDQLLVINLWWHRQREKSVKKNHHHHSRRRHFQTRNQRTLFKHRIKMKEEEAPGEEF